MKIFGFSPKSPSVLAAAGALTFSVIGLSVATFVPGSDQFAPLGSSIAHAEKATKIPLATRKAKESGARRVAVFAGGCFWGVEGVFEHVKGVKSVKAGYAGGSKSTASYGKVSGGNTGHAEAVKIVYDPSLVRYDQLLRVFFSVAHDPTQLNRQGPDTGTQYRSAIFPQSSEQRAVAKAYIAQLGKGGHYRSNIVTKVENGGFYTAETKHQNYMRKHPSDSYIVMHDKPKLAALKSAHPGYYKASSAP